ncbi:S41 family peptidase [uncultured Polaribacter sp.]|uniref:S41 family peptidase n=1 Tax=uncultured Polaribacter sp. TaxID=174711 RepID=UPI0026382484|nr:S41 family peptidase [uncultured Polaribacter sp.]
MKHKVSLAFLFIIVLFFSKCANVEPLPENLVIKNFIWKGLNAYYLHQEEVTDLADRRFNSDEELNAYLSNFSDFNTLFNSLLISTDVTSNLVENYTDLIVEEPRAGFVNGMEFGIINQPGSAQNVLGYVTHILPNSNASSKNIVRGEFFNAVNGTTLTRDNFENLLVTTNNPITIDIINFDGNVFSNVTKTVTLEKENYNYPTSLLNKVIVDGADNIGYLIYNNSFSNRSIKELNNTFLSFKNQSVNKLILDLRYSISGSEFDKNMINLATLITGQFTDEILIKKEWNAKAQTYFLENEPEAIEARFPNQIDENTNFNSLNVNDVYIILNNENFTGTASIELLINSLKPYINVTLIGNNTAGNTIGSITLYDSEDYNFANRNFTHTVALQPKVLSFTNKNDETYENGFIPSITICNNEDVLNLGVLGEQSEPILKSVLNFIATGSATTNSNCNPNNFQFIYNSIDNQRQIDNGVFIDQNLPNTN